jgi:hypothetical protein
VSHAASKPPHSAILVLVMLALLPVVYVWAELAYRATLFHIEYHSEPYLNHVDDGYFTLMPQVARIGTVFAIASVVAAILVRRRLLAAASLIAVVAGFLAPLVLAHLHARHTVVTYAEFTTHEFGGAQ